MFRAIALALFCVVAPGIAAAQQGSAKDGRQARPGESCLKFHADCGLWCDGYQSTCLQTGV